jgi:hypothetical protein
VSLRDSLSDRKRNATGGKVMAATRDAWDLSSQSYEQSMDQLMLQEAAPVLSDACDLLLQACEEPVR